MTKTTFHNIPSLISKVFGNNIELLPSVDELFELELAYLEFNSLSIEQLIGRSAFIKSIDNQSTKHYLLYSNYNEVINENRSAQTQTYFEEGQFSTGYATHGLFPYRGKFHPQLIKGLLNILGVEKGETLLDPMAGSGTANVEAALMGINSIACDVSPFCQFMIKVKYESLKIDLNLLKNTPFNNKKLFDFFKQGNVLWRIGKVKDIEKQKIYNLAFLAWLDALGYSKRVVRSNHEQLFEKVLPRYIETVKSTLKNPYFNQNEIGKVEVLSDSEALNIKLPKESIDCIITSPPYSFAIDYVENDKDQLEFLGYDTKGLKNKLIGLRGKNKTERLNNYFKDMDKVCAEISRVLKKDKYFCMIIGSNTNQTGGIRLEETIINSAKKYSLPLVKSIHKPIKGMRNTMKDEYILIFKKL
ncbi:MAG TPA: DNA methyltransferase [Bacteroidales bacterium]|nr:DNA methyltransferase [Bacteroidales bacterium]HQH14209.1 DNA methyltransferase [Bacteroidales bacterium]